jgi:hypothetical protein
MSETIAGTRRRGATGFSAACVLATLMLVAATPYVSAQTCGGDNGGITLPPGFCATIFADKLGHARQMAFGPNGWPECYYDGIQNKLVLAPEYGGDGKKIGDCANKKAPVASFPGHWAPNDLLIYSGDAFPAAYQGGAFVAFHGSWNRSPDPQGGYNVVFQPLKDGKTSGPFVVFADGFAGAVKQPGQAAHRPSGLAMGPDGALIYRTIGTGASGALMLR